MSDPQSPTLQKILAAGKAEFLQKGFKSASLRNIVKNAGVTTGAFYGYFSGKEALYAALVEEHAAALMQMFMSAQEAFASLPEEEQPKHMGVESKQGIGQMLNYIYDHYDEVKLLICKSEGTAYENFIHNMVEIEVAQTIAFTEVLKSTGRSVPQIDRPVCHMIASGMLTGIFELIVHDTSKEDAFNYINQFEEFFIAGWSKILGL